MTPDDQLIDDLAQAVLDGDVIDWAGTELERDSTGPLIRQLKVVAALADAHRKGSVSGPDDPVTPATTAILERWGHLRICERVGRGAFGEVYRAWDTRLDREVALKLIPVSESSGGVTLLTINEGRLLARVRHSNVATIYGADQIGAHVGLWMEFVHGRSLEELLHDGHTFEPAEVAHIGLELAKALDAVHSAGLLHRDVKAQNVMRSDDGRIVLMDFGTGRELDDEVTDLTGTPLYLAPELLQGQPATPQSDIYSLGVLLHHLLTNSYPVHGKTMRELRLAHERSVRFDRRAAVLDVPAGFARVIERALSPRLAERYATAKRLGADLEHCSKPSPHRSWLQRGARMAAGLTVVAWLAVVAWPVQDIGAVPSGASAVASVAEPEGLSPDEMLASIRKCIDEGDFLKAYKLAEDLEVKNPGDAGLAKLRPRFSAKASVVTTPDGARVNYRPYDQPGAPLRHLGTTPLRDIVLPRARVLFLFYKPGYQPGKCELDLTAGDAECATLELKEDFPPAHFN